MKSVLLTPLVVLLAAFAFAGDEVGEIVSGLEAVFHEGIVTFTVVHPEAVSASVRVYDLESDGMVFDSGPRARTQVTWPVGDEIRGSFRYLVTAWNAEGEVVVSQTAANKRQTPISEITFDTVPDNTSIVGDGEIDMLGDVNIGTVPGVGLYQDYGGLGYGGGVVVYGDSTFDKRVYMSADSATGAGYFRLSGPVGGFWIDGSQHLHGNEPAMSFYGGTSEFQFYAGETGDDSVVMPDDAVSATEILNEPGVASSYATASMGMAVGDITILTASITAPTNGYVFSSAFVSARFSHTEGLLSYCSCSISETPSTPSSQGVAQAAIPADSPSGQYRIPISMSRVIPVSSGVNEIYIVCTRAASTNSTAADGRTLNLLFVPTAY